MGSITSVVIVSREGCNRLEGGTLWTSLEKLPAKESQSLPATEIFDAGIWRDSATGSKEGGLENSACSLTPGSEEGGQVHLPKATRYTRRDEFFHAAHISE